jgi:hypothetical protein
MLGNFWAGRYFADFDDLERQCAVWLNETANVRVHRTTCQRPVERFAEERVHLLPLPGEPFDTDWVLYPKMSKDCVVRVDTNDYSVPWQVAQKHLRQPIEVQVDGQWVRILDEGKEAACHPRCYARHQQIIDRSHYDGLWQSRAATAFATLERGFLEACGDVGRHFYTGLGRKTERLRTALEAILRLERQYPHEDILAALEVAVQHSYFLLEVQEAHRLSKLETWLMRQDLIVLDEVGFVPFSQRGAQMPFASFLSLELRTGT